MRTRSVLVLATVAGLLAVAGTAAATPPQEAGWSPASYGGDGNDLDLSHRSDILGFATADPGGDPNDQDLHFLTVGGGPLASQQDSEIPPDTEGKDHVVVSDDGTGLAAGVDAGASGPSLFFFNRSDAQDGVEAWSEEFPLGVTDLAITPDGDHLAVATADDSDGTVYLIETRGGDATVVLEDDAEGPVHAVAVGDEGNWLLAGGETVVNGSSQGTVALYSDTAGSEPVATHTVEEDLPGAVRTVELTPDAEHAVAGTAAGRVASFVRDGSTLSDPHVTELEGSQVAGLEIRADGALVAAGATDGVHLLERPVDGPEIAQRWTDETPGPVVGLDASANLTHVVAAVSGASGGVFAYHESRSEPIWTLPNGTDAVAVDAEPGTVVASRGSNVSAYPLVRSLDAGFPGPGDAVQDAPDETPSAQENVTTRVNVALRNTGSVTDTYDVSARIAGDWNVSVASDSVQVLPNETETVEVAVRPGNVAAGLHNVTVTASSQAQPTVSRNFTLPVRVQGTVDLRLNLTGANATRPVEPGDTARALLIVENKGNKRTDLQVFARLSPSGSPAWSVEAPDQVGPLDPGASTSFHVRTEVPADAADGDARVVDVTVQGDGQAVSRSVRYVVNPFRDVSLSVQPDTRFVNATVPGFYNLTVENQGSIDTDFQFIFEKRSSGTPGWTIQTRRSPFVVESGQSRTIPMRIIAPQNGVPDDRVVVKVQVVPRDLADQVDPDVQDNVTVSAVFKDLPDPNDDEGPFDDAFNDVPGPGLGAAALAAAAAAAGRRRGGKGSSPTRCTSRTSETYKNMQAGTGDPSTGPPCRWSSSAR